MTRKATKAEWKARRVYDPAPGTVHLKDLIAQVKDGHYAKDKLSDYLIGMILWALVVGGLIEETHGCPGCGAVASRIAA